MDVENEIKNLKHALDVQKVTNSLLLIMIMRTVDVLSPKGHVFEVLKLVAEEQKRKIPENHPVIDEAFKQVLLIVSAPKFYRE